MPPHAPAHRLTRTRTRQAVQVLRISRCGGCAGTRQPREGVGDVQRRLHHTQRVRDLGPAHHIGVNRFLELRTALAQGLRPFVQSHKVGRQLGHLVQSVLQGLQRLPEGIECGQPGLGQVAAQGGFV